MSASVIAHTPVPSRLGRYRLLEPLGGGATSVVYAAHDEAMDRPVAVKMIVAELADEREARARFYREAMVTAEIRHRNIVPVLDVGEDQGRAYIVMTRLNGWPLPEFMQTDAGHDLDRRVDLIMQLFDGLQAAHDLNVVHRDIKPTNLFVERDGCLKILDFGLARLQMSTLTANGQIVGTPDYMSPEQAEGRRVDGRSDIFSAAAVSYFILTGRSPFAARDLRQTLNALLLEDPRALEPSEAPEPLARLLFKGLAKSVDTRYQTCRDVIADLERVRGVLHQPAEWPRVAAQIGTVSA